LRGITCRGLTAVASGTEPKVCFGKTAFVPAAAATLSLSMVQPLVNVALSLLLCCRAPRASALFEMLISNWQIIAPHTSITIVCKSCSTVKTSQTPSTYKFSGRLHPTIISIICFCQHLVVLFIFANLNFRNVPHLFSFLSGAAAAMNQPEAISESLDSVRR
jgi:hypothetical protein